MGLKYVIDFMDKQIMTRRINKGRGRHREEHNYIFCVGFRYLIGWMDKQFMTKRINKRKR